MKSEIKSKFKQETNKFLQVNLFSLNTPYLQIAIK